VTLEQANAVARKYLVKDQRSVVITLPAAGQTGGAKAGK